MGVVPLVSELLMSNGVRTTAVAGAKPHDSRAAWWPMMIFALLRTRTTLPVPEIQDSINCGLRLWHYTSYLSNKIATRIYQELRGVIQIVQHRNNLDQIWCVKMRRSIMASDYYLESITMYCDALYTVMLACVQADVARV